MNFVLDLWERHEPMFWLFGILIAGLALNRIRLGDMKSVMKAPQVGQDDNLLERSRYEGTNPATGLAMSGSLDSSGYTFGDGPKSLS